MSCWLARECSPNSKRSTFQTTDLNKNIIDIQKGSTLGPYLAWVFTFFHVKQSQRDP